MGTVGTRELEEMGIADGFGENMGHDRFQDVAEYQSGMVHVCYLFPFSIELVLPSLVDAD